MQKGDVVLRLLVPTDQQPSKTVQPRVGAFHNPSARPLARLLSQLLRFFSSRLDVGGEAKFHQRLPHFVEVVALVQAHPLRLFFRRGGTLYHYALDGLSHQLHVVAVSSIYSYSHRHTMSFSQYATLHPALTPVSRIGAGFFPRPTVLWSSPRPCSTTPTLYLSVHRTAALPLPTASGTPLLLPTAESGHERWNERTGRSGRGQPIGSRYAARRIWHRHIGDQAREVCRHRNDGCFDARARAAQALPTTHQIHGTLWWLRYPASASVFAVPLLLLIRSCFHYTT